MTGRADLHGDWTERKRRAAVVAAWRREQGDVCPGWRVPAHLAVDLCADHEVPVGAGGDPRGPLGVLCRACNSSKRDGRRPPQPIWQCNVDPNCRTTVRHSQHW